MNYPSRIALDSENRIYVLDSRNYRVQVFNNDGSFHKTIGGYGSADGLFKRPSDIAVDRNDMLYVADAIKSNVQVFDTEGNFVKSLAEKGTEDGQLYFPYSLSVDDDLFVYVIDSHRTGNSFRLQIFSPQGELSNKLDVPLYANGVAIAFNGDIYVGDDYNEDILIYDRLTGALINSYPVFTSQLLLGTLTGLAIGPNGDVYVASARASRIDVYDEVGVKLRTIGLPRGSFDGQFNYILAIAMDGSDNIYVLDNNHVHVLDATGKFLRKFGALGTGDGAFTSPQDLTVDENGLVYVMDAGNRRVVIFNNDGSFSRAFNVNTPYANTTHGIAVGGDVYMLLIPLAAP
jgi:DNA-binding beta-propeller fold protein YncE